MAKATIAMAMKETGFGQDALKHLPEKTQAHVSSGDRISAPQAPYGLEDANTLDPNLRPAAQQQQRSNKRPAPRFDMNLKDLFSEDESVNRPSKMHRALFQPPRPTTTQVKREPSSSSYHTAGQSAPLQQRSSQHQRQQQPSPQQLFSPSTNTSIDPSLQMSTGPSTTSSSPTQLQHQQQQQQRPNTYFPILSTYSGNPYADTTTSPYSSLDFLDGFQSTTANLQDQADGGASGFPDYDLGFGVGGLAFDGGAGPSWDETGGFDLFDGFFFGGTNGGGGGGHGGSSC